MCFYYKVNMVDEKNLSRSFKRIKADIIDLQGELLGLKEQMTRIAIDLEEIGKKVSQKSTAKSISKKRK